MEKILLAIHHRETEAYLKKNLKDGYIFTNPVSYREAILNVLKESQIDILLLRDELEGSTPMLELIEKIRIESPQTRIIFISQFREKNDPFLASLVSYGIYDIINKNKVHVTEMISHIQRPRTFRDVSIYYNGAKYLHVDEPEESDKEPEKKGFLSSIFGSVNKSSGKSEQSFHLGNQETGPEIDIDSMRDVIRQEERRKAQEEVNVLINNKIAEATTALKESAQKKDEEINDLKANLTKKSLEADRERMATDQQKTLVEQLESELNMQKSAREKERAEHAKQIAAAAKIEDPQWFQDEIGKMTTRVNELEEALHSRETELQEASKKLEEASAAASETQEDQEDHSQELDELRDQLAAANKTIEELKQCKVSTSAPQNSESDLDEADEPDLEINTEFLTPNNGKAHTIIMMGSKHGVGNTMVSLNTAVTMAKQGYKVMVLELNPRYPMLNHFFEFVNITNGIDTACDGILSNNTNAVDLAIIKPRELKPKRRDLKTAYKRLPAGLHFMLYSNGFLNQNHEISERAIKDMFYYLTVQLQYAYIFVDLQPDDEAMKNIFLQSGFLADKLILTMTQDTHSITTAAMMLEELAKGRSANLVQNALIVLNRYQHAAMTKKNVVQKFLKLQPKDMVTLMDDPIVYYDSNQYATPYACSKAKGVTEFDSIANYVLSN